MYKPLSSTNRCQLFEEIAEEVWNRIIRAHQVNANLKEVGITADIIVEILHYNRRGLANFDVYARPSWDEQLYGSDIDVFVETLKGQYRWFALQAKLLKKNNRYDTFRDTSNNVMQWDKLRLLEGVSGCKAYYLLYNGKLGFTHEGKRCKKEFTQQQFGCSLVEPTIVENLANRKIGLRFRSPRFEDFHPLHAEPWKILTCCYHNTNEHVLYSLNEIESSDPLLRLIDSDESISSEDVSSEDSKSLDSIPFVPDNEINRAMLEANWNPTYRFIIHRTDNI